MILVVYSSREKIVDFLMNHSEYYDCISLKELTARKDSVIVKFVSIQDDLQKLQGLKFDNVWYDECKDIPEFEEAIQFISTRVRKG